NVDGVMKNLVDKSLIRISGRKKAPGSPYVFGTTRQFLEYFGLNSLEELPKVEDFKALAESKNLEEVTAEDQQLTGEVNESRTS
ncbi:MAG: SMC-Scp complex subunit ScpB, partial [Candidatus Omnitrophica bacterium]|nr:SMC-Scp complex subunit ScpB [Candidatus Omnitrophota bacterium]